MKTGKRSIMKKSMTAGLVAVFLFTMVLPTSAWAKEEEIQTAASPGVRYQTHIQDYGWENSWKTNGSLSGTVGESKRLESMIIELTGDVPSGANIQTIVHVQDRGDMGPFSMGEKAGTQGYGLRMERVTLVLNNMPGYTLKYDVQVENLGWLRDENNDSTWFTSGQAAGTTGKSLRLESIKIKLVKVNSDYADYKAALAAVDELDYTTSSWAVYQEVVDENVVSETDSSGDIQAATAAIKAAQLKLVKGKNLAAYKAALAAVKEAEYIAETWTAYMIVVEDNVVTQANTQIEINAATNNILAAQKKLQKKVDLTAYKEALAAVRAADYSTGSWATYQTVLAANVMTENNTQTQVDAATQKINDAQKAMVRKFDFTAYKALLDAVKEDDYTTVSWTVYQKVVMANYIDTENVTEADTQTKVEAAIKAIEAAQKKLVLAGDLTAYRATLDAAVRDDYTTASWTVYQKVLDANVVTRNNKQTEIDAATAKIMAAQLKLMPAGDLTQYEAAIKKATDAKITYTTKSWAIYQKVVAANVVTPASGQTAINAATDKILAAQDKLEKKGVLAAYNAALGAVTETHYTSASWATYMKVVNANKMTEDNAQSVIDAATDKIIAAQSKLVPTGKTGVYDAEMIFYNSLDNQKLYTSTSWAAYDKVVQANYVTSDNSDDQIKAAVAKIQAERRKLILRGTDFSAYTTTVAQCKEADYTVATWTPYKKVLATNLMNSDKSQPEIDKATLNIAAAQFYLVKKGILTAYEAVISDPLYQSADDWTTKSWTAYQAALLTNTVTTEDTQSKIDGAAKNIRTIQLQLVKGADLEAYIYTRDKYKGRDAEFTEKSWTDYQAILYNNQVTKDNTQLEVNTAKNNIALAQNKLVSSTDLSKFLDAISTYKENLKTKTATYIGDKAKLATTDSWAAYATWVELYASFDAAGEWKPVNTDVTVLTPQSEVDEKTNRILEARSTLVPSDEAHLNYTAYSEARELYKEAYRLSYTVNSFNDYWSICQEFTIPVPIDVSQTTIDAYTKAIEKAKDALIQRAAPATIKAFEDEVALYSPLNSTQEKTSLYGTTNWATYKQHYITLSRDKAWDPLNNGELEYAAATKTLQDARLALTLAASGENIYINTANVGAQAVNTNIVAAITAYLDDQGFDMTKYTVTFARKSGDTGSAAITTAAGSSYGQITDKGNGAATVTFTITPTGAGAAPITTKEVILTIT